MMKKVLLAATLVSILLAMASCKTSKKISEGQKENASSQYTGNQAQVLSHEELNGTWIIRTAENKPVVGEQPVEITLDLSNGRMYGNDGCNVINSLVILDGTNGLRFESVISTMMACTPDVTDHAVQKALNNTRSYQKVEGKTLSIQFCDEQGKTVMTLEKRMVDQLNGSWKVVELEGKAISEENPILVIDIPESRLTGFAGCNRMFGNVVLDGTPYGISFTEIATTRMSCPDMSIEQAFVAALNQAKGFAPIDTTHATLYQEPGKPLMTIERGE